eukprot:CAMPEP_0180682416 /NCGR_PEP_ID=MMETSP1037_2-20121125/70548_1 /TAXON_ID=632150 /ORGANISM="Azadinium spinosum, Strain 3D9" /LENGTH=188 /DNA_ID=CAMNT_0022712413 /DNA_START=46 /DNA_END=610 /DNA_ORIENTATION=+
MGAMPSLAIGYCFLLARLRPWRRWSRGEVAAKTGEKEELDEEEATRSAIFWVHLIAAACGLAAWFVNYSAGKPASDWLVGDDPIGPYGTCHMAQANLFQRHAVFASGLPTFLERRANLGVEPQGLQAIDTLLCKFFKEVAPAWGPMWSTDPSLFQHMGINSSHPVKVAVGGHAKLKSAASTMASGSPE